MPELKSLGSRLTLLRKKRGMIQKEIAAVIAIKKCTYASYEEDRAVPPHEIMGKLVAFYGIPIEVTPGIILSLQLNN